MKTSLTSRARVSGRRWACDSGFRIPGALCGVSSLAILCGSALAQEATAPAPAHETQLEEITVTARYRTENVQQTPIAITALTNDDMQQRGFQTVLDVSKEAPNVVLDQAGAGYGKSATAFIRGVGQNDFNFALEPGVGFYIDDVYFGTVFGSIFDVTDIDRVEVLRGPQGTLFGKNNEGGAIRLYTTPAKGDDSGYVEAGYGSFNREQVKGAFDVAVVPDKLFIRVSGSSIRSDGYEDRIDFACAHPALAGKLKPTTTAPGCVVGTLGGDNVSAGRLNVRLLPIDDLDIQLEADVLDDRGEAPANKLLAVVPNAGVSAYNASTLIPIYGIPYDRRFLTSSPYQTYESYTDLLQGFSVPSLSTDFSWGFGGTIDWKAPWGFDVKSVTGYRGYNGEFPQSVQASPLPLTLTDATVNHHQFSEEVDVTDTSKVFDRDLEWTVGGLYFTEESFNGALVDLPLYGGIAFGQADPSADENESGFLHGVYHLTDQLSFEAGYRYTNESKTYVFYRPFLYPQFLVGKYLFPVTGTGDSYGRSDAKVGVTYQWSDNLMLYTSIATGFKAGGFNPRPLDQYQVLSFKPEDLTAVEVGEKSQWFDNRLRANVAAFVSDYKDLQLQGNGVDTRGLPAAIVTNVGHVIIEGAEAEVNAEPLPGLRLDGSTGYVYYNTVNIGSAADVSGGPGPSSKPPYVPKWEVNLGAQYSYSFDDLGTLTTRLDWNYRSSIFFDANNLDLLRQPGYGLLSANITWFSSDDKWQASLRLTNLTDQVYYINKFDDITGGGTVTGQPGRPREVLFSVRRTFEAPSAPAPYTPPPAPAAPAAQAPAAPAATRPEQARQFQVFFDFDKAEITAAADVVIKAAVEVIKAGGVAHISVTGHTDTVGSAAYNQGLSERRAASVKAALVAEGVAAGEIATRGVGKKDLLVPTADGVREPQNRRAIIELGS